MPGTMSKSKPKPKPERTPPDSFLVRPDDPRLITALDDYAASIRRSRNMAAVLLLEEILSAKGHWPPAEDTDA